MMTTMDVRRMMDEKLPCGYLVVPFDGNYWSMSLLRGDQRVDIKYHTGTKQGQGRYTIIVQNPPILVEETDGVREVPSSSELGISEKDERYVIGHLIDILTTGIIE